METNEIGIPKIPEAEKQATADYKRYYRGECTTHGGDEPKANPVPDPKHDVYTDYGRLPSLAKQWRKLLDECLCEGLTRDEAVQLVSAHIQAPAPMPITLIYPPAPTTVVEDRVRVNKVYVSCLDEYKT